MNLSSDKKTALLQAKNLVWQNKASISWVGLFGKVTLNYVMDRKPEKVVFTLKYENNEVKAFDSEGKEIGEIAVSQELSPAPDAKTDRPRKQQSK